MVLKDKIRLMLRDYTVSDILYALEAIYRDDSKNFYERNELISATENAFIADKILFAANKIAYIPQYGPSITPEPQGAENESQRINRGIGSTK